MDKLITLHDIMHTEQVIKDSRTRDVTSKLGKAIYDSRYLIVGVYLDGDRDKMIPFPYWLQSYHSGDTVRPIWKAVVVDTVERRTIYDAFVEQYTRWDEITQRHYITSVTMGAYRAVTLWHRPVTYGNKL